MIPANIRGLPGVSRAQGGGGGGSLVSHSMVSDSLRPHRLQPTRLLSPWNSPGKNTGVSCHSLLQGIFPTQGLNLGLLHCRWSNQLNHQDNPKEEGMRACYPCSQGTPGDLFSTRA